MINAFPLFIAVVIVIGFFVVAKNLGVVSLLSSAVSFAIGIGIFFLIVGFLPDIVSKTADIQLKWQATVGIAGGAALLLFIVTRIIVGFVFKSIFGPDGFLHFLADGVPGGILSLFPSLVIILFLFTCIRISGTLHELNYTASLSRDGIAQAADQIPSYPWTGRMRDAVENLPGTAMVLDLLDPFSNRANRNAAAFSIMNQSSLIRAYLLSQPDAAKLAAHDEIIKMNREGGLLRILESHDRVRLVMAPKVRDIASDSELKPMLRRLPLQGLLVGYVKSLKSALPEETPNPF